MESADENVKDLQQGQKEIHPSTTVHAVSHKRGERKPRMLPKKTGETACYRCGGQHSPRDCQYKASVCHACKKRVHLARVCRTKGPHGTKNQGEGNSQQTHSLESEVVSPTSGRALIRCSQLTRNE